MHVGIDVGFGGTKAVGDGKEICFRSVIGEFQPVSFSAGLSSSQGIAIEYGRRWYVGDMALKQSAKIVNTVEKERTVKEEGKILLAAALALLLQRSCVTKVVVGLPVLHFESMKDTYLHAVQGTHIVNPLAPSGKPIEQYIFSIQHVKVIPQPFGTIFDHVLNSAGELNSTLAGGKIGVIDIGYNTVDLCRADAMEYIGHRSTSFSGLGVCSANQILANEIFRVHGIEVPVEKIDTALTTGITKACKPLDLTALVRRADEAAAAQILSKVQSFWSDMWELDTIILTGGGAARFGKYLNIDQAIIPQRPHMTNAIGYHKFARRIWKDV